jgi:MoaA/NifB/PqqE/SkfB family radical SAM enzyme
MYKYEDIKTIHLENTQNCQASCPMCDRNMDGKGVNPHIDLSELTLEDCKRIFEPDFIKQLNTMYMCGNLGDPIVARDTLEIFKYFRKHNPKMWLSMNTNAGAKSVEWWQELAQVFGRMGAVIFSVDGLSDTNHLYRQGVVWNNVERNMRAFIAAGGRARWDFLIFQHNEHQVEEVERVANAWGCERFTVKKSGRFVSKNMHKKDEHQAKSKKGTNTTSIKEPINKKYLNKAVNKDLFKVSRNFGSLDNYYDLTEINCKSKKDNELFITAEGLALPCCWTAGRMYKWYIKDPKQEQIWDFIDAAGGKDAISAKKHGLRAVFETGIFDEIEASWSKPGCKDGKLKVCSIKCGKGFDLYAAQFK